MEITDDNIWLSPTPESVAPIDQKPAEHYTDGGSPAAPPPCTAVDFMVCRAVAQVVREYSEAYS
ncbi:MAG TPA: hypothetical protein VHG52_09980 [Thermomicrobiales bacterium]|nr:hypothetical protein [Thermomicrobiales bacterium]